MKKICLFIIMCVFITQLFSCRCDRTINCPALSDSAAALLPFNSGDSIKFINATGSRIKFVVTNRKTSPSFETFDCMRTGLGGCYCGTHQCRGSGNIFAMSDTTINTESDYFIRVNEEEGESKNEEIYSLEYSIFDLYAKEINLIKPLVATAYDSLLPSLAVGNHTYSNVYIHIEDTVLNGNLNKYIWKVYYAKTKGIVGFRTRPDQNYFYLE